MIAVNLTESQVEAIAGAGDEVVVRGPNGELIGYLDRVAPEDMPRLSVEQILEIQRRMADPIEMTITTDELRARLDALSEERDARKNP